MNYHNLAAVFVPIFIVIILSGCALFGGQKDVYTDSVPYDQPEEKVWSAVQEVLRDYTILKENRREGLLETIWFDEIIGVGRYESSRKKLYLEVVKQSVSSADKSGRPAGEKNDAYVVKIMVKVQHNKNLPALPEPESMQWKDAGFDETIPQIILWKLDRRLLKK
ncbi:MAG: hypothetical protein AAB019_06535 [Planctomycetota bacterium]